VSAGASLDGRLFLIGGGPCGTEGHCYRPHCPADFNDDDTGKDDDDGNPTPQSGPYAYVFELDYSEGLKKAKGVLENVQWGEQGTASWVPAPSLKLPRCALMAITDEESGNILAAGGIYEDTVETVEVIAMRANETSGWSYGPPMMHPRYYGSFGAVRAPPGAAGAAWHAARRERAGGNPVPIGFIATGSGYSPNKDYGPYLNYTEVLFSSYALGGTRGVAAGVVGSGAAQAKVEVEA
jgi:hypothetical protein